MLEAERAEVGKDQKPLWNWKKSTVVGAPRGGGKAGIMHFPLGNLVNSRSWKAGCWQIWNRQPQHRKYSTPDIFLHQFSWGLLVRDSNGLTSSIQIQIYTNHISSGDSLSQQFPTGSLKLPREANSLSLAIGCKSSKGNSSVTEEA